uniref:C2H2-type domain-containing protein n=1 Tax=Graphocephala atropunctata TaxID=36148 RepID=A0A1B6MU87_9HEMI
MPRTKKQFRRQASCSDIKILPLNGEPNEPNFKGWDMDSLTPDKLLRYKKLMKDLKSEVEMNEDIVNEVKSILDFVEKTALEMRLKELINSLPSFTEDPMRAAMFILELTYDSDEEMSDSTSNRANEHFSGLVQTDLCDSVTLRCENESSDLDLCNNDFQERADGSLAQKFQTKAVKSLIQDFQTRTDDEKLRLRPIVVLTNLNHLEANKNNGTGKNGEEINLTTQRINENKAKEMQNTSHLVRNFEQSVKSTQFIENSIDNNVNSVEENFALIYEGSDEEENFNSEMKCSSRDISEIMQNTPKIKTGKSNSQCELRNKHSWKNIEHPNLSKESVRNLRLQRVTVVRKLSTTESEESISEDKKDEKTVVTFLDAVSEVTNVSQILSLVDRKFTCMYCKVSFIQKNTLRKHIQICSKRDNKLCKEKKQKNKNDSYTCKVCGTRLRFKKSLSRHNEQIHNLVKSYKCVVCRWGFYNERLLQHHVMSRHGLSLTKHMKCPYCDCAFRRRDDLRAHCKKHKKKYFLCSICFETFADESVWKAHEQDHGFNCDVCDFLTLNKDEIATHKLTHLKMITYKCAWCPNRYNSKRSVTRHMKLGHKQENS